ncbi:TolC family protein [Paraflavitalea sp. CAU 1676]|uniref:TolC family protein n=1 Tax=Paraflavitalea sp. CAU 1676 TaxID=3032598 RepID=UPI0023DCB785|nr:TolC family protein [Paraflavitalea sp. CAU 1676]MDF2189913.1 TolC family protein [Paraflavitalea sp. CAU 1676]
MNRIHFLFGRCMVFVGVLFCGLAVQAQDTLRITLQAAEQQFFQHNLSLLAARYDITAAQAQVIQARLYNNPNLSVSGNLYNPDLRKPFDVTHKTGQYDIQLTQLISLAGKRNKQIKLATTQATIVEYQFYDLLRTLRYTLRSHYFSILRLHQSRQAYQTQVRSLQQLSVAYNDLLSKGVVTLKDAVRIQSLLYTLQAEQTSIDNQLNDLQAEWQLLLNDNHHYYLPVEMGDGPVTLQQHPLQSLLDSAFNNRYDLKAADANTAASQQHYQWQKALRTPDLQLGLEFDKRGSFVNDATFLNAAMDLPFFNRNQGNIKAAQAQVEQSKVLHQQQELTVENEVQKAYIKALNSEKMLQSFDPAFHKKFDHLLQGITENFQKKNISLLEFTDFYESWRDNILRWNQLRNEKDQALESLNFALGKNVFN